MGGRSAASPPERDGELNASSDSDALAFSQSISLTDLLSATRMTAFVTSANIDYRHNINQIRRIRCTWQSTEYHGPRLLRAGPSNLLYV